MARPIEINDLESHRFGIVAARLTDAAATLDTVDAAARAASVDMITSRVDASDLARVHALEEAGYRLMDTLVYHERPSGPVPPASGSAHPAPRRIAPDDIPAIAEIAAAAFTNYVGHYHADPRLDNGAADAAYVEWAESSARHDSEDNPVLILRPDGQHGGFLTMRRNTAEEFEVVLNAVHPDSAGQGLYTVLLRRALDLAGEAHSKRVIISTQINNYPVQRIWSRLGFTHYRSVYTFHKWYGDQRAAPF